MEHSLFSERWVLWQEVWPKSGMTVDGSLLELAMPAHLTGESESLSLPTPSTQDNSGKCRDHGGDLLHEFICGCARSERKDVDDESLMRTPSVVDGTGGAISEKQARERGRMVKVADQAAQLAFENGLPVSETIADSLLPTPTLGHLRNHDEPIEDYLDRRGKAESGEYRGMPGISLGVAVRMETLPTPKALDGVKGNLKSSQERLDSGRQVDLPNVAIDLMPTPLVDDAKNTGHNQTRIKTLASEVWETERTTNWGKFEPAIRRCEQLTRPAPAPTKPDGKNGNHRLSSLFVEWMMMLPAGWVTGHGLKRNDELKMLGNGVVPSQAALALRLLLGETTDIPKA
jgi:DNA (cytosine-5)-methyltransferase 1